MMIVALFLSCHRGTAESAEAAEKINGKTKSPTVSPILILCALGVLSDVHRAITIIPSRNRRERGGRRENQRKNNKPGCFTDSYSLRSRRSLRCPSRFYYYSIEEPHRARRPQRKTTDKQKPRGFTDSYSLRSRRSLRFSTGENRSNRFGSFMMIEPV